MKLFAELYLDEDVSVLVAALLKARGFDALTARDAGMLGQDDSDQLEHATSVERCIVTHNRVHFEQLHRQYVATGQEHHGIVVAARRTPQEIAQRLATLLNSFAGWAGPHLGKVGLRRASSTVECGVLVLPLSF